MKKKKKTKKMLTSIGTLLGYWQRKEKNKK